MPTLTIDGVDIQFEPGETILEAAQRAGVYIPHLCWYSHLPPASGVKPLPQVYVGGQVVTNDDEGKAYEGCGLCVVEIEGSKELQKACSTLARDGMKVKSDSAEIKRVRQQVLQELFKSHPHACLLCAQSEGCDRVNCSSNVPEHERCCDQFGKCELEKVAKFIGLEGGLPPYEPLNLPVQDDDPLIHRDYNLCIGCLRCVRACKELRGADALGYVIHDGRVVVGSKEQTAKASGCHFCGYCVEVCPTGALTDKLKAIGRREEYLVPCKAACPAGIDVPEYVRLIKEGKADEALKVIYQYAPLPATLGRVCFHPCEEACRRGQVDEPVSICALKRFAADQNTEVRFLQEPKFETDKKVAVVGSGPAGLTCAFYLRLLGHSVTIFEALPVPGGMLRVGIPDYRLPKEVLNREIKLIENTGIEIRYERVQRVGELKSAGFDAVVIATGAHEGRRAGIPGEELENVLDGISFLRSVNLGQSVSVGKRVAVIGGGNVAIDAARCARRLGAETVTIFYRRSPKEMPAYREEVEQAVEEEIRIEYLVNPIRIDRAGESLQVTFARMELGEADESGRARPVAVSGSEFDLSFDTVIFAVGQQSKLPDDVEGGSSSEGIFLAGDVAHGPATVIEAIASGRETAKRVDQYLGGEGDLDQIGIYTGSSLDISSCTTEVLMDTPRVRQHREPAPKRITGFEEVICGLTKEEAQREASRCIGCNLRLLIPPPVLPPEKFQAFTKENIDQVEETEGVYILYNEEKEIYNIVGTENLREALREEYEERRETIKYFAYEIDPMYTSRERQLIQNYMKEHGTMPPGSGDELDDLF